MTKLIRGQKIELYKKRKGGNLLRAQRLRRVYLVMEGSVSGSGEWIPQKCRAADQARKNRQRKKVMVVYQLQRKYPLRILTKIFKLKVQHITICYPKRIRIWLTSFWRYFSWKKITQWVIFRRYLDLTSLQRLSQSLRYLLRQSCHSLNRIFH